MIKLFLEKKEFFFDLLLEHIKNISCIHIDSNRDWIVYWDID